MRLAFSRPRALACLPLALLAVLPVVATAATPSEVEAAKANAVQWIKKQQEPTGQIPGFGGDWTATAFAAAGVDVAGVRVTCSANTPAANGSNRRARDLSRCR